MKLPNYPQQFFFGGAWFSLHSFFFLSIKSLNSQPLAQLSQGLLLLCERRKKR
ncbi:hypothetical protein JCM15093_2778 [Bacteroides graminisolvens DSM 19988 = JCM 15093]|jgi:hypothetical protein|uniref:Uncharacterized protein n=1 Tax=Bacteroides graminisolvens DSM 19988 = JCM 15093 TaxID=1121097 RepID=A0A069DB72_9BACE|nr:hypothetical protein JCM15093_2778 [Bacteroides graminisolvens DSM 19988 = JCM 15093]